MKNGAQLMFMTYYARLYPTRPCSEILSVEEHRALSAKANGSVQCVGEAVLEIAKLGVGVKATRRRV